MASGAISHSIIPALINKSKASQKIEDTAALDSAVGDLIAIICHLARGSNDHYKAIFQAELVPELAPIICSPLPELRAKMCNLIGNLCKHGDHFYSTLMTHPTLLAEVCTFLFLSLFIFLYFEVNASAIQFYPCVCSFVLVFEISTLKCGNLPHSHLGMRAFIIAASTHNFKVRAALRCAAQ